MIDVKDLRENPEKYRRGAELKNVTVNISAVLDLDGQCLRPAGIRPAQGRAKRIVPANWQGQEWGGAGIHQDQGGGDEAAASGIGAEA